MKQLIATIICSAMIIALFCILPVTAQDASGQPSQEQRQEPIPLSDELTRKMLTSSEKKIPVMIRFRDDYNEASIEDEALIEAKNSKTSLSVARNKVLAKHVTLAREAFLNSAGIAAEDVESYCSLIPLISLARVTPEQIKQLTLHPNVLAIEYVDTAQKSETFALDGTTSIGGHIAPTNSYTGTNTRIGIVDVGHPNTSLLN